MKTNHSLRSTAVWINLPTLSLLAVLQRTPAVRVANALANYVVASPLGAVLKSAFAAIGSLGAVHSLAGATQLATTQASPATVAAGAALTIGFSITGTLSEPETWTVGGAIPPGLAFNGGATSGTIAAATLVLSGTPTTAGTYAFRVRANDVIGGSTPDYSFTVTVTGGTATGPTITTPPQSQSVTIGGSAMLSVAVSGTPAPTLQWLRNGAAVPGATSLTLALNGVQPATTGLYAARATNSAGSTTSETAIVGLSADPAMRVTGAGMVVGTNILHPNGNRFDQVLVTGAAEAVTADFAVNRITRTSYIDLDDDIVQVEFSGPGTLSLVLDGAAAPAAPVNYNQPNVSYIKGHAGIAITGANENTNISVFTVGRATAVDPTGRYSVLQPPSATNNPANNGSSLFIGHETTNYDGVADIAFIAISSANGKFGGLRTGNASCFASKGLTGVYAPGVNFVGPVVIGDISAFDDATPAIVLGSASDTRIAGGDMLQDNGRAVVVSGIVQLKFVGGGDSTGRTLSAQNNRATYRTGSGADVTAQIVVNP